MKVSLGTLTLLLIGLKLAGVLDLAWGWVLLPLWVSLAVVAVLVALMIGLAIVSAFVDCPAGSRKGAR